MKDSLSVMGLRAGFLEAYSREPYSERSTSLFHRRVVLEVIWGPTNCSVRNFCIDKPAEALKLASIHL